MLKCEVCNSIFNEEDANTVRIETIHSELDTNYREVKLVDGCPVCGSMEVEKYFEDQEEEDD